MPAKPISSLAIVAILTGLAACTTQTAYNNCFKETDPARRIDFCTSAIDSGDLSPQDRAAALTTRALAYTTKEPPNPDRAIADADVAIAIGDRYRPSSDDQTSYAHRMRGIAYQLKDQMDRALNDFNTAIRLKPDEGVHYFHRGGHYLRRGMRSEAARDYAKAVELKPKLGLAELVMLQLMDGTLNGPNPSGKTELHNTYDEYAGLYAEGRYEEALPFAEKALKLAERRFGSENANTAGFLYNLARLYDDLGRFTEAEPLYERALAIREKALGPGHPEVVISLDALAEFYRRQHRYAEAEPLYTRLLAIREKALGPEHPNVATSLENYAALLRATGRPGQAVVMETRARAIRAKQAEGAP